MSKKYIQVDDTFFKIEIKDGIPNLVKVKPNEAISHEMENIVITGEEDLNVSMFQEIIDKARADLKTQLESNIKGTVLGLLGFEKDRWGGSSGYRVDHCNGRMSAVTELISSQVRKQLLEIEIGKDFVLTDTEKKRTIHRDAERF